MADAAPARPTVRFRFEGREIVAADGASVAAALLGAGVVAFGARPGSGAPRGPFCLMGACFDCLVEIDGAPNRQACMTPARDGMEVKPMPALGSGSAGGDDGG